MKRETAILEFAHGPWDDLKAEILRATTPLRC
jgi:hypothetical protein